MKTPDEVTRTDDDRLPGQGESLLQSAAGVDSSRAVLPEQTNSAFVVAAQDGEAAAASILATSNTSTPWWKRLEDRLERMGERLNPILVKETRQAMKSRQFTITFVLLLACSWLWSLLGVAMMGPEVYFSAQGKSMFYGYFVVLAFPLLVIVPYGAFRSLAGEREDRTYELLSITTLKPRQIVSGKLGSAVVQMIVYLSALAPCLAFTYLLRGIDVPTIFFVLFYTVLTSLGLSAIALLIATVSQEKHWQVVLSVLLIFGLGWLFFGVAVLASELLNEDVFGRALQEREFWLFNAALMTGYVSYFVLITIAAACQLTFSSDNRSTPLRIVMVLQHALFAGWMAWAWIFEEHHVAILLIFAMLVGINWYVMGAFMTGEVAELSPRVKRKLPQSFLGRVLFTWFNPGPGTGYVFAVANAAAAAFLVFVALAVDQTGLLASVANPRNTAFLKTEQVVVFAGLGLCYVVIYLGLGRLVIGLIRRLWNLSVLGGLIVHGVVLAAGCGIPLAIQIQFGFRSYTWLQIPNVIWTMVHVIDTRSLPPETPVLLVVVPLAAAAVFLLNMMRVVGEVRHVRVAEPARVAEEKAALNAQSTPPEKPSKQSPWD